MFKILATFLALTMVYGGPLSALSQGAPVQTESKSIDSASPFKKCWEYQFENTVKQAIASTNGTIYLSEPGGKVRAISAKTGQVMWVTELGGDIAASLAIPRVGLVVVTSKPAGSAETSPASTLRLLNFDTGLVRFSSPMAASGTVFLGSSGSRLFVIDGTGNVAAVEVGNGSMVWSKKLAGGVRVRPAFGDNTIAIGTTEKKIELLSPATGRNTGSISSKSRSARMRSMSTEPTMPRQPINPTFFMAIALYPTAYILAGRCGAGSEKRAGNSLERAAFALRQRSAPHRRHKAATTASPISFVPTFFAPGSWISAVR